MILREYQKELIDKINEAWKTNLRVALQLQTGAGKTALATEIIRQIKGRTIFIVHRRELIQQTAEAYNKFGLEFSYIASGYNFNPKAQHYIGMIQTIIRRDEIITGLNPELAVIDEFHLSSSNGYQKLVRAWTEPQINHGGMPYIPRTKMLGLSATPVRLDGRALDITFQTLITGPPTRELMSDGYLADYDYFAGPEDLDLKGVHTRMGDYSLDELAERVNRPQITGNAVREYQRHLTGKQAIVFCINVRHSQEVAAQFVLAGIPAAHLDGNTSDEERERIVSDFKENKLLVLTNCQLFIEGFNIPNCNGCILLRPTQSLVMCRQSIGRVLRKKDDNSKAIILDHAGNYLRHGMPDDEIEWSLEGLKRRSDAAQGLKIKTCKKCFAINISTARECKVCGEKFIAIAIAKEIKQTDDILVQVKPLQKWSKKFWDEVRIIISDKNKPHMKALRGLAQRAGLKPGLGYYMYKAFIEERRPVPEEGYVKL